MLRSLFPCVNRCIGLLLIGLGFWVVMSPEIFTSHYGIGLDTSEGRSVIRALVGGTEITLGILFLVPNLFQVTELTLLRFGALLFLMIFLIRLIHLSVDDSVAFSLIREMIIEGLIGIVLLTAVFILSND